MKAQMKFQKALSLITLIVAAICFVFAICFFSGNLSDLLMYKNENLQSTRVSSYDGADDFLYFAQDFVTIFVVLAIVFIVCVAILYITDTNKRRNYYVTNYVAIGIIIAISAAVAFAGIISLSIALAEFYAIDWEELVQIRERANVTAAILPEVSQDTTAFIFGYIVSALSLATGVVWVLNLVWKIKLMKGEKALLEGGLVKEVA